MWSREFDFLGDVIVDEGNDYKVFAFPTNGIPIKRVESTRRHTSGKVLCINPRCTEPFMMQRALYRPGQF